GPEGPPAGAWLAGTAEFAAARIAPGPRTPREIATMLITSALTPPDALTHHLRGRWRHRHAEPWPPEPWPPGAAAPAAPAAVLDAVPAGSAARVAAESGVVAR
ncbi:transferase, partial [Cryptosporangium minutisporangium]